MQNGGLLLIDKKAGETSREVDNHIGRRFNTRKVGHLGTLDPFATGLLIVAVNNGTKFLPYLKDEEKTYEAILSLGKKTSSGDNTGELIEEKEVHDLSKEEIEDALSSFLGTSEQIPPMTSAKKIDGKPLYKLAHQGLSIDRKPIKIEIYEAKLNNYDKERQTVDFSVKVSKGTYIRTLGEDLAEKLNTVGHLISLRRTSIGNINVKDAKDINKAEFVEILPLLSNYERYRIEEGKIKWVKDGKPLIIKSKEDKILVVVGSDPLAIYKRKENDLYVSERGLF